MPTIAALPRRLRRKRAVAWCILGIAALHAPACAKGVRLEDGRYRAPERAVSIAPVEAPGYARVAVEGARLTFRGPGGATLSWIERCSEPGDDPKRWARGLLIGLEGRQMLGEESVSVAGAPGFVQRLEARQDGRAVGIKTVSRVGSRDGRQAQGGDGADWRCHDDWVLVVPGSLDSSREALFDAWWESFEVGSDSRAVAGGEGPS